MHVRMTQTNHRHIAFLLTARMLSRTTSASLSQVKDLDTITGPRACDIDLFGPDDHYDDLANDDDDEAAEAAAHAEALASAPSAQHQQQRQQQQQPASVMSRGQPGRKMIIEEIVEEPQKSGVPTQALDTSGVAAAPATVRSTGRKILIEEVVESADDSIPEEIVVRHSCQLLLCSVYLGYSLGCIGSNTGKV
jgi:hypothetical protein